MKKVLCFILICATWLIACTSDKPSDVLDKEKMKLVMKDVLMAEEFVKSYVLKDSTKKEDEETIKLYNQVFKLHNTNRQQFLKSFDYYISRPYLAKEMFDSLSVQMRRTAVSATKTVQ
jgi:hypothetical protein